MTDVRTEIKAINTELHTLEVQFEDWFGTPRNASDSATSDRPSNGREQATSAKMPSATVASETPMRSPHSPVTPVESSNQNTNKLNTQASTSGERPTLEPFSAPSSDKPSAVPSPLPRRTPNLPLTSPPPPNRQRSDQQLIQNSDEFASVLDEKLKELEQQANHVNQLADQQESALLKLKAIAEAAQFEAIRSGIWDDPTETGAPDWLDHHQFATIAVVEPDGHGRWILRSRPVDWFQDERNAVTAAEQLRRLQNMRSHNVRPGISKPVTAPVHSSKASGKRKPQEQPDSLATVRDWIQGAQRLVQNQKTQLEARSPVIAARLGRLSPFTPESSARAASRPNEHSSPAGVQFRIFVLWIVGAAAVRIGLNLLSAVAPSLVPVAIIGLFGIGGLFLCGLLTK